MFSPSLQSFAPVKVNYISIAFYYEDQCLDHKARYLNFL